MYIIVMNTADPLQPSLVKQNLFCWTPNSMQFGLLSRLVYLVLSFSIRMSLLWNKALNSWLTFY